VHGVTVRVTAPGKVVLLGEYAVLEGAPALVMAVDRRVRVTISAVDRGHCSVSAPGWCAGARRFRLSAGGPQWMDADRPELALASHLLEAFFDPERVAPGLCPAFDLELDSTGLTRPGGLPVKLGLGSSAALTVALSRALGYYVASQQPDSIPYDLQRLIEVHAEFQGRRGSGLDIASSLHGGVIEFTMSSPPAVRFSGLPEDMSYTFIWSGRQAATGEFLARLERWRGDHERRFNAVFRSLKSLAEGGAKAARRSDAEAFLEAVNAYADALERLGTAAGADIVSEPHRRLRALAGDCGVVYKPCGAGGGDIGVAMGRDAAALARLREKAATEGFEILSLRIDQNGVEPSAGN